MVRRGKSGGKGGEGETLAASLVSIRDFAAMTDLSAEWVRLRIAEGVIPKAARGKVALGPATRGAARYFEAQAKRAADWVEDESSVRYRTMRAEQIEGRNARTLAALIARAEAVEAMEIMVVASEAELRRLLAGMPPEVGATASEAIAGAMDRIGKRFEDLSAALATGDFERYEKAR